MDTFWTVSSWVLTALGFLFAVVSFSTSRKPKEASS